MSYSTIDKPTDYFNTKLYSGTGSSQAVTGVGFQPDWIWFKCRTQAQNHNLFDAIRGSNKIIQSSTANAEATSTALLTSFDSDGFTVNTDGGVNGSGQTYASWNWLANNTSGSSNTDGSITSTVSANTTSGFSIVSYTGTGANATVGHGLNATPKMIIMKNLQLTTQWQIYHESIGNTHHLQFDASAKLDDAGAFNDTSPTSSVFSLGASNYGNGNGNNMIAYCFAEKKGYSKFGSYTGNGNADGTFVYLGFKPAWVLVKNTSGSGDNWILVDNKRLGYNPDNRLLFPNAINADFTDNNLDLLSNGFKARVSYDPNGSGNTMIYMAFAESPFVTSTGIPTTAR
jgi:hypothetical protein